MKEKEAPGGYVGDSMSKDIILIEPHDNNAMIPPSLKMLHELLSQIAPIVSQKRLESCGIYEKDIYKFQTGIVANSPRYFVKTGLLCIAAYLIDNGYKVKYLPLNYYLSKLKRPDWLEYVLKKTIKSDAVVGITATTPEYKNAIQTLRVAKAVNENITTVIGGPFVTYADAEALSNDCVDIVVRGEGEQTMLEIVQSIDKGLTLEGIKGITYRNSTGLSRNPDRPFMDIGSLPMPAYEVLPEDMLEQIKACTLTSRGCLFSCAICAEGKFWNHCIRYRDLENVVDEIQYMVEKFKAKFIHLADSTFDLQKDRIIKLCELLEKRDLGIYLSCNIRADSYKRLNKDVFSKMRKVGFIEFEIGVESGSNAILKSINKGITFEDSLRTLHILKKIGNIPFVRSYWIIGTPKETHYTLGLTMRKLDWLYKKNLIYDSLERVFVPYPNLDIFRKQSEYGLEILSYDWDRYRRFCYPPVYRLKNLSEQELLGYIIVMKSIQLKHHAKWACLEKDVSEFFYDKSKNLFIEEVPP